MRATAGMSAWLASASKAAVKSISYLAAGAAGGALAFLASPKPPAPIIRAQQPDGYTVYLQRQAAAKQVVNAEIERDRIQKSSLSDMRLTDELNAIDDRLTRLERAERDRELNELVNRRH